MVNNSFRKGGTDNFSITYIISNVGNHRNDIHINTDDNNDGKNDSNDNNK